MIRKAYYAAARAALERTSLDALAWRHHGLGMLQSELNTNLRVHIWHPKLRHIDGGLRAVHDHRFDLVSAVIVGSIRDTRYNVYAQSSKKCHCDHCSGFKPPLLHNVPVFEIAHAKIQGDGPISRQVGLAWVEAGERSLFSAGHVYCIRRREFHTTEIDDLAVTVVASSDFDDAPARVLENGESGIVKPDLSHWRVGDEDISLKALRNHVLQLAHDALVDLSPP